MLIKQGYLNIDKGDKVKMLISPVAFDQAKVDPVVIISLILILIFN